MKVPKNALNGSNMMLMGFPECGSSYFLLMQLDKDFKPIFKLLETQPDPSGKAQSLGDSNNVIRIKNVDVGKMQMFEDELNLSLLDSAKLLSLSSNSVGTNQSSERSLLTDSSFEGSVINSGLSSSFSSIVDEVFELELGSSAPSFSVQSLTSTFNTSPAAHFGSGSMNVHNLKAGTFTSAVPSYGGSIYSSSNLKGLIQSGSATSLSSGHVRSTSVKKLSASKSEQDLASLRSPAEVGSYTSMDEDQLTLSGSRSTRLLSPQPTGPWVSAKANGPRHSSTCALTISSRVPGSSTWVPTPVCKTPTLR